MRTKTGDTFEQFLARMTPGDPSADTTYLSLRSRLIKYFSWHACDDPAELCDETIGRMMGNLDDDRVIERPSSYVFGIARNVLREHQRSVLMDSRIRRETDLLEREATIADFSPFAECCKQCFERLSDEKRMFLEKYYGEAGGSRDKLASEMGLSLVALRIRVHRLRANLRECREKCMKGSS